MKDKAMGFDAMKKDHWQKDMSNTKVADLKYGRSQIDNEPELTDNVNKLADYVKKNRNNR